MNQLDQLIRELEGADYYREPEEETHIPIYLGIGIPVIASWVVVIWFCLALLG